MAHPDTITHLYADMAHPRFDDGQAECLSLLARPDLDPVFESQLWSMLTAIEYYQGEYSVAILAGERAVAVARTTDSDEALVYAIGAQLLATAGFPPDARSEVSEGLFDEAYGLRFALAGLSRDSRLIAGHQLCEAIFASGRLTEASEVLDLLGPLDGTAFDPDDVMKPMTFFMLLRPARLALFQGNISLAHALVDELALRAASSTNPLVRVASLGMQTVIAGYLGDRPATKRFALELQDLVPEPRGYLQRGFYAVTAYGLNAAGDLKAAADLIEKGCGTPGLPDLQTADRALCYEILASAALADHDLDAARAWGELLVPLSNHPAAAPMVARTFSSIELAIGSPVSGAELAEVAVARAQLCGSFVQESMGEILRARSLAQSGARDSAIGRLQSVAASAESRGNMSLRQSAARELRLLGRRVASAEPTGWDGLSQRERQIALLAAEGHSNRIIATTLFLSERTVQAHMSRVLSVLGVPSRTSIPSQVPRLGVHTPRADLPALTKRQRETAELVAAGASNHEIAESLGISVKTVEKHIGEVFLRWGVSSRTGIATTIIGSVPVP
jgi:DNA-binding NarL/FixJ family response regulator